MKALLAIVLVAALGVGGYYVFGGTDDVDPAPPPVSSGTPTTGGNAASKSEETPVQVAPKDTTKSEVDRDTFLAQREEERRKLWEKLRPMSERFLPDPDNVGPCPPAYVGARAARVERRYVDPRSGARVWIHEDGSYTQLSFGVGEDRDPRTGRMVPKELVITGVPEAPQPIAPDELPLVDTSKK
ncbi:MAG: hypothetical protein KDC95_10895 [Planctomycetes bacterium]|nr:hypothetical protein [Planctomycetota bacterium]